MEQPPPPNPQSRGVPKRKGTEREKTSWIWQHGIQVLHNGNNCWQCKYCKNPKPYSLKTTSSQADHLREAHYLSKDGPITKKTRLESQQKITAVFGNQQNSNRRLEFQPEILHILLLTWIVIHNLPHSIITSIEFLNIIMYLAACQPNYTVVRTSLPTSTSTVTAWVKALHAQQHTVVKDYFVKLDIRQVNFSFDLWKGPNHRYYLGIVGHWFDPSPQVKRVRHVLLGLRNLVGIHNGDNQGTVFWEVLESYGLIEQLGWFTLDNGANNGTTLRWIADKYQSERGISFDPKERFVSCFGHVMNLIVEAFLYGKHHTSLKSALNEIERARRNVANDMEMSSSDRRRSFDAHEDLEMAEWRKTGPIGKLRNIITLIMCRSQSRRELFTRLVKECKADARLGSDLKAELLIIPNDTRWNSMCDAITRARLLRPALEEFFAITNCEDALTQADWQTLSHISDILSPLRTYTLTLEGNRDNGALYDIIRLFEILRKQLKAARIKHLNTRTELSTSLEFALKKLDKYYNLNRIPPVVYAAVILHPRLKMQFFDTIYHDDPTTCETIKEKVQTFWEDFYYRRSPDQPASQMYSEFQQSQTDHLRSDCFEEIDAFLDSWEKDAGPGSLDSEDAVGRGLKELDLYLMEARVQTRNPIEWWIVHQERFPLLSKLAFDILSIPAMSAECERVFSNTKLILTERRCRMADDSLEANQLLRSWLRAGLIEFSAGETVLEALRELDRSYRDKRRSEGGNDADDVFGGEGSEGDDEETQ